MLTLKSSRYTKEDYEYLMRVVSSSVNYCIEHRQPSLNDCKACPHNKACRDLQDLAMYCRKQLRSIPTDC